MVIINRGGTLAFFGVDDSSFRYTTVVLTNVECEGHEQSLTDCYYHSSVNYYTRFCSHVKVRCGK